MTWIKCSDRLPEKGEKVLCYDTARIYIAYRYLGDVEYNEHWGICEDQNCSCVGSTGAITHWMPLPTYPIVNTDSQLNVFLLNVQLSNYIGRKCKFCKREYDSVNTIKQLNVVYAGNDEYSCRNCWDFMKEIMMQSIKGI